MEISIRKFSFFFKFYVLNFKIGHLCLFFFCVRISLERRDNMLNQVVLVGRLVRQPELRESEKGKKLSFITLAVPRSFKNMKGEYDTDFSATRY